MSKASVWLFVFFFFFSVMPKQGAGDTEPLLLAAGDIAAALLDPGVVPIRESLDELVGAGRAKVTLDDLRGERLAVYLPARVPVSVARIHGQLMGDRPPSVLFLRVDRSDHDPGSFRIWDLRPA